MTATFTLAAFCISVTMAIASFEITSQSLTATRERSAIRNAYYDASIVNAGLSGSSPDIVQILRSLDTGSTRHTMVYRAGAAYARNADAGYTHAVPDALRQRLADGHAAVQRVRTDNGPALAIGIPLPDATQFYVIDSLTELDTTLRVLSLVLSLVAAATTAARASLGAYAARRMLRPLHLVADAATDIADGDLSARLDPATEPDLGRLTHSFNRMVDRLAARQEQDRRFAADVSHELRSPLQTLAAASTVLKQQRDALDSRAAEAAELVADETSRFTALVTDLLELARADQPADRAPVDVAQLLQRICRIRHIDPAVIRVTDEARVWEADDRRLEQTITNLIDNAVKHGGGVVAISARRETAAYILEVDDKGPGVPVADREAIFGRFFRGRAANDRGGSDRTGLGLALVAEHVRAHHGRVYATDRPGGGARFRIELRASETRP